MNKEQTQAQELQKLVDTWTAMQRFSFYVGVQRGIMSSMNTIMLKYAGMSFEQFTKVMVKPQLHQVASVGQCMNLLASLLKSVDELVNAATVEAQQEIQKEKENEETTVDSGVAQ